MERKIISCVVVGILLLALGSTSWSQDVPKILKIGVICALTGPGASWGISFRDANILLDDKIINVGGERYKVKLIYEDNKYTAKDSVTAMNKLIFNDKVKFVSVYGTPAMLATTPIVEENRVMMTGVSNSPSTAKPGIKYVFRLMLPTNEIYPSMYKWLSMNKRELKKIAQLAPHVEYGEAAVKSGREATPKHGMEIVYQEYYEPGTQDFYPHLTKMIGTNPDILDVCLSFPSITGLIIKQARELGWKGLVISGAGADPEDIVKVAGATNAEGYLMFAGGSEYDMSSPVCTKAEQAFYKKYVDKYGYFRLGGGLYYDYVWLMLDAIQQAGSLDVEKVRKVMETAVLDSVSGPSRFGIEHYGGHQFLVPIYISRIHNGKAETFARIEWKDWMREAGHRVP